MNPYDTKDKKVRVEHPDGLQEPSYFIARSLRGSDGRGSGNAVTVLLAGMLHRGELDEVLTVRVKPDNPTRLEPFFVNSPEELWAVSGSKYAFVPYGPLIHQLGPRSGIIGVVCQVEGALKVATKGQPFKVGLFTGLCKSEASIDFVLEAVGIGHHQVVALDHRAPGVHPLIMEVCLRNGHRYRISHKWWNEVAYTLQNRKFTPLHRCLPCDDHLGHYSDVAVGDYKTGWSALIIRTKRGLRSLEAGSALGEMEVHQISLKEFQDHKIKTSRSYHQKEVLGGYKNVDREIDIEEIRKIIREGTVVSEDEGKSYVPLDSKV